MFPSLWWAPVNPCLHRRPSNTSRWFWLSPVGPLLLSCRSWSMQYFVCDLQDWSFCFPQSFGSPIIKSHWPSRSDSLGIPNPFVESPGWEAWHQVQKLYNNGRTSLVILFSSLWVTHLATMGFEFIVTLPSYHLAATSSLSLDMGHLSLVSSSVLLSMVVQQLAVILVPSQEQMRILPSTLPSRTGSPIRDLI